MWPQNVFVMLQSTFYKNSLVNNNFVSLFQLTSDLSSSNHLLAVSLRNIHLFNTELLACQKNFTGYILCFKKLIHIITFYITKRCLNVPRLVRHDAMRWLLARSPLQPIVAKNQHPKIIIQTYLSLLRSALSIQFQKIKSVRAIS
jgi:hypothetical protein